MQWSGNHSPPSPLTQYHAFGYSKGTKNIRGVTSDAQKLMTDFSFRKRCLSLSELVCITTEKQSSPIKQETKILIQLEKLSTYTFPLRRANQAFNIWEGKLTHWNMVDFKSGSRYTSAVLLQCMKRFEVWDSRSLPQLLKNCFVTSIGLKGFQSFCNPPDKIL